MTLLKTFEIRYRDITGGRHFYHAQAESELAAITAVRAANDASQAFDIYAQEVPAIAASIARRDNLVALINTYNESSSPSVPRTDAEHDIERDRAKIALGSIRRNYTEGTDYKELSNGALWPVAATSEVA